MRVITPKLRTHDGRGEEPFRHLSVGCDQKRIGDHRDHYIYMRCGTVTLHNIYRATLDAKLAPVGQLL